MDSNFKICFYCDQPILEKNIDSLHNECRIGYAHDMDEQDEVLKKLKAEIINIEISYGEDCYVEENDSNEVELNEVKENKISPVYAEGNINELSFNKNGYISEATIFGSEDNFNSIIVLDLILKLKRLEKLWIRDMKVIEEKILFDHLTYLNDLDLENVDFKIIPDTFSLPKNIKIIVLRDLPALFAIKLLRGITGCLEELLIFSCEITEIPDNIFSLTELKELFINNAKLTSIPEKIKDLSQLQILDLSHNNIMNLPNSLSKLINLIKLDLEHNLLDSCKEIQNLPSLEKINISGNKISDIWPLGTILTLTEIKADDNNLKEIPLNFLNLENLNSLSLKENSIIDLSSLRNFQLLSFEIGFEITIDNLEILQSMTALTHLVLSTEMTIIPDSLNKLTKLKRLAINTKLENVPLFVFELPAIKAISLYKPHEKIEVLLYHLQGTDMDHLTFINKFLVNKYSLKDKMDSVIEFEKQPF